MKKATYFWLVLVIYPAYAFSEQGIVGVANDDPVERFVRVENMVLVPADAQAGTEVTATVGEFVIVRKQEDGQSGQAQGVNAEIQTALVIRDQVVGDYGLSDGTFFVFFHDRDSLEKTVQAHGLHVEDLFVNAKMARVSIDGGQDVFAVMRQVQQDPRVRGVELNTTFDRLKPQ